MLKHFVLLLFVMSANNAFALFVHNDGIELSATYLQSDCPSGYYEISANANTFLPINNVTGCGSSYTKTEISNDWKSLQYEEIYVHNDGIELSATYSQGDCPNGYYEIQPASFAAITGGQCQSGFSQYTDLIQCADEPDSALCPMLCESGYNFTYEGTCSKLCTNGMRFLRTSIDNGIGIPLYDTKTTSPSMVVKGLNDNCYINLKSGHTQNALHVQYNNSTYYATY